MDGICYYIGCSLALASSIILANILYRSVEYPSYVLSKKIDAGLLTSGSRKAYAYRRRLLQIKPST